MGETSKVNTDNNLDGETSKGKYTKALGVKPSKVNVTIIRHTRNKRQSKVKVTVVNTQKLANKHNKSINEGDWKLYGIHTSMAIPDCVMGTKQFKS